MLVSHVFNQTDYFAGKAVDCSSVVYFPESLSHFSVVEILLTSVKNRRNGSQSARQEWERKNRLPIWKKGGLPFSGRDGSVGGDPGKLGGDLRWRTGANGLIPASTCESAITYFARNWLTPDQISAITPDASSLEASCDIVNSFLRQTILDLRTTHDHPQQAPPQKYIPSCLSGRVKFRAIEEYLQPAQ